jgi:hypothetical protein
MRSALAVAPAGEVLVVVVETDELHAARSAAEIIEIRFIVNGGMDLKITLFPTLL